jgi:hypothetical protein
MVKDGKGRAVLLTGLNFEGKLVARAFKKHDFYRFLESGAFSGFSEEAPQLRGKALRAAGKPPQV